MPLRQLGRRPALIPAGLRDLTYYAAGPLPAAPASVAIPQVADWNLLGNGPDPALPEYPQGLGDCGVAGLQHGFMAAAADTGSTGTFPDSGQAASYYMTYDDGQDNGVVLSAYLRYVQQNGYYGLEVEAYAPVAVQDVNTLRFAINAYDFAYLGITVTQAMMDATQGPAPWTWTLEEAGGEQLGGHCIIACGYDSNWIYCVTWGEIVRVAYPAWAQIGDEAWAVLTGEISSAGTDGHGLNLAALKADISKLSR
jgi:hypothetical protein